MEYPLLAPLIPLKLSINITPCFGFPGCWIYINVTGKLKRKVKAILEFSGIQNCIRPHIYSKSPKRALLGMHIPDNASDKVYISIKSGSVSNTVTYVIEQNLHPPTITSTSYMKKMNWLYIFGTNFTKDSIVRIDGTVMPCRVYSTCEIGFVPLLQSKILEIHTPHGKSTIMLEEGFVRLT